MKPGLVEIDSAFVNQYKNLLNIQQLINYQLSKYPFDLNKTEITDAIIARMDAFWFFNVNNNKEILDRKINTTSADFFTETCLLFLKSYFGQKNLSVFSEKILAKSRIRPDISIWHKEELIAVIELKVSDGWKRKNIIPHIIEREQEVKKLYPHCFFGVLVFWNFFNISVDGWGTKYIGLKQWNEKENHPRTSVGVEQMIKEIEQLIP